MTGISLKSLSGVSYENLGVSMLDKMNIFIVTNCLMIIQCKIIWIKNVELELK